MTGYNEIRDAVMKILKTAYPTANIYGEEIQQGYIRPAFFVQLLPEPITNLNTAHRQKMIGINIHHFPGADANQRYRDMWEAAANLDALFSAALSIDDRMLSIHDAQPEIVDEVLQYQFTLQFIDSRDDAIIVPIEGEMDNPLPEQILLPSPELGYVEGEIVTMQELEVKEEC